MSEPRPKDGAPTPPPRDLVREARRLARLQHLRVVPNEAQVEHIRPAPDPKRAA
jgi:hypothetical protein